MNWIGAVPIQIHESYLRNGQGFPVNGSNSLWRVTHTSSSLSKTFSHHRCDGSYPGLRTWERRGLRRPAGSTAPSCECRTPGLEREKRKAHNVQFKMPTQEMFSMENKGRLLKIECNLWGWAWWGWTAGCRHWWTGRRWRRRCSAVSPAEGGGFKGRMLANGVNECGAPTPPQNNDLTHRCQTLLFFNSILHVCNIQFKFIV